jgi:chemotaxis methyl-accepting protein methylase
MISIQYTTTRTLITITGTDNDKKILDSLRHLHFTNPLEALEPEWAKWKGYRSKAERELFKQQVKEKLGWESLAAMVTMEEVTIKIEELHQLASEEDNYTFAPYVKAE